MTQRLLNLSLVLIALLVGAGFIEGYLRLKLGAQLDRWDEKNAVYRYDADLGWFPLENYQLRLDDRRLSYVAHNSRGFRDPEPVVDDRPGILFLGDSFVWGYDVERHERFTDRLKTLLPEYSVFNLGVSGYGTDQEYLLLQKNWDFYHPALVVLVYTTENDNADNGSDVRYGYFKPYFVMSGGRLELRGQPVPKSFKHFIAGRQLLSRSYLVRFLYRKYLISRYPGTFQQQPPTKEILLAVNRFVQERGGRFVLGINGSNPALEDFARQHGITWIDLTNPFVYPDRGKHWTPAGHEYVAARLAPLLRSQTPVPAAAGNAH